MDTARREELKSRWRGCMALPQPDRGSYLEDLSRHDREMAAELESLLRAEAASGDFLERGFAPALPKRLGVWQPVRELGRGGMGQVFHAIRALDGFEQQAALKTLRDDLATPGYARRFQRERQILARLDHPNIARLLDGGEDEQGRPYLAMEFIDGQSIDAWAAGKSADEKLALVAQVCRALDYAHRHLVVHCDLKPSNIMVNSEGEVKLLDFGIARLLTPDEDSTSRPHLTPHYASPEQLRNQPLTTGSDIYSLGVVLYKLLTGRLPYAATQSRATDPVELARQICDEKALTLGPGWAPDLEAVVAKALRKDAADRYASASAMAADIEAFRRGRSVAARPLSRRREAWRFLRRHKWESLSAAFALAALVAVTAWALQQRAGAQRMLEQSRRMSGSLIWDVEKSLRLDTPTEARKLLLASTAQYLNQLAGEENLNRSLAIQLGESYRLLGNAIGDKRGAEAQAAFAKGLAVMRPWGGDPTVRFTTAKLLVDSWKRENVDRAIRIYEALEKDPGAPSRGLLNAGFANAFEQLGVDLARSGDYPGTENAWQRGLSLAQESNKLLANPESEILLARMYRRMGAISSQRKKPAEAVEYYGASSALEERAYARNPAAANTANLATSMSETAYALRNLNRWQEAEPLIGRSAELRRKLFSSDPKDLHYRFGLSNILLLQGENRINLGLPEQAGPILAEAESIAAGLKDGGLQKAQVSLAIAKWETARPGGAARARAKAAEALKIVESLKASGKLPNFKQSLYDSLRNLARYNAK